MAIFDILLWYGAIALTHLFIQLNLAHIYYLKMRKEKFDGNFTPSVLIVIPSYNEDYESLKRSIDSTLRQEYGGKIKVMLVDDGSSDRETIKKIKGYFKKEIELKDLVVEEFEKNKGKRHAQKHAFDKVNDVEIIVTIDSDTILRHNTIANLVQKFKDPIIGAVTGDVRVINKENILTRLIDCRYWTAFNQERAAQSLFGTVLCCSGPLAAYRKSVINKVKDKYISQRFLGEFCTYGDDRHLTNLVLERGYQVKFEPKAKAKTDVPSNIKKWLRQQARWNRSFYRELLWTIRIIIRKPFALHPYIIYDVIVQTILPLLLFFSLIYMIYRSFTFGIIYLYGYLTVLGSIAFARSFYALIRTKDKSFFLFPIYAILHVFLLIPVRIFSLLTMKTTRWGTR